jgi:hypothetical protein
MQANDIAKAAAHPRKFGAAENNGRGSHEEVNGVHDKVSLYLLY